MRSIIICNTCKFSPESKTAPDGRTGGEILIEHMRDEVQMRGQQDVVVETQACLWNCNRPCSVVFRDDARFSYATGGHEPSREQAGAILDWFYEHGKSEAGEVPFRLWPDRMKGHFLVRMPPFKTAGER